MPRLACRSCGRQIYTVAPLEALFAEERRCPRCGSNLRSDRREAERRLIGRRKNPPDDPGPPIPPGSKGQDEPASDRERRLVDRRVTRRRDGGTPRTGGRSGG